MRRTKLLKDSFFVNNETFSNVEVNEISCDLYIHYNKDSDNYMLSILDSQGDVIHNTGITSPKTDSNYTPLSNITIDEFTDSIEISWVNNRSQSMVSIEKSIDGVNFNEIATLNTGIDNYTDYNVSIDSVYYRFRTYICNKYSNYSEIILVEQSIFTFIEDDEGGLLIEENDNEVFYIIED